MSHPTWHAQVSTWDLWLDVPDSTLVGRWQASVVLREDALTIAGLPAGDDNEKLTSVPCALSELSPFLLFQVIHCLLPIPTVSEFVNFSGGIASESASLNSSQPNRKNCKLSVMGKMSKILFGFYDFSCRTLSCSSGFKAKFRFDSLMQGCYSTAS